MLDREHVTDASEAHTLIETENAELRLWDTPGFGDTARLMRRLRHEKDPFGWFLHRVWDRVVDRPLWCSQEAVRNVRDEADVVLYLVNAAEDPGDAGYVPLELEAALVDGAPGADPAEPGRPERRGGGRTVAGAGRAAGDRPRRPLAGRVHALLDRGGNPARTGRGDARRAGAGRDADLARGVEPAEPGRVPSKLRADGGLRRPGRAGPRTPGTNPRRCRSRHAGADPRCRAVQGRGPRPRHARAGAAPRRVHRGIDGPDDRGARPAREAAPRRSSGACSTSRFTTGGRRSTRRAARCWAARSAARWAGWWPTRCPAD